MTSIAKTAANVAWLKWRHRNGCYRWLADGRCIDCLQRTGTINRDQGSKRGT